MRDFAYGMKNNILKEKFEESLKYLKRLPDLQDDYWNAYNSSFLQMDSELYRQPEDAIVECHANFESLMQEIEQTLINSSARRQENP